MVAVDMVARAAMVEVEAMTAMEAREAMVVKEVRKALLLAFADIALHNVGQHRTYLFDCIQKPGIMQFGQYEVF